MADLVGAEVEIPGPAWSPPELESSRAMVIQYARPTRLYPEGRYLVHALSDNGKYWWDVRNFPASWVVKMPPPGSPRGRSRSPGRRSLTSPQRSSRKGAPPSSTNTPASASRRRRSGAGSGAAAGSSMPSGFSSDGEGGAAAGGSEPKAAGGPAAHAYRPRKSIRFADDVLGQPLEHFAPSPKGLPSDSPAHHHAVPCTVPPPRTAYPPVPVLSLEQNIRNALLIVFAAVPAVYYGLSLRSGCSAAQYRMPLSKAWQGLHSLTGSNFWCALGYQQPLAAVNLVFLLNVDVLFWVVGLVSGSFWLIDAYWTIIPPMIGLFYQYHPAARALPERSTLSMGLLWVWAARLTHSYLRREEYQFGAREDWRYADMARKLGRLWWVVSFFAVGVAQHVMLVGITLPLLAIHTSAAPWDPVLDTLAAAGAVAGLLIAWVADNQLRAFTLENERRVSEGEEPVLLLEQGLWFHSRHPNYFGEQLWWWSLAGWAWRLGRPWMVAGAAFNSLCLVQITLMTEKRMLARHDRAHLYRAYQATTSVWVPWFKHGPPVLAAEHKAD